MKTFTILLIAVIYNVSGYGQSAKKFYKAGEEFFDAKKYQDAIAQYTSAINLNPDYEDAYFKRGMSYELTKEYEKAATDFARAIVFEPKNEELYYHLGKAYYELKKYTDALNNLNKSTSLSRKYLPPYQEKILVYIAIDQSFNALKVSDSALSIDGNAYNYYLQGQVTEKLNSAQKAEWAYMKSIKQDKKFINSYIALANLQVGLNKLDEAMKNANEAVNLDQNSKPALIVRSKVYLKKLDYRNGIDDISRAIVLNPNDEELFFIRGTYYQQFSQHQNAVNDFNKVISINPKNAEAYYKRATSFEEVSNIQAAIKDYETLAQISEYDVKAKLLLKDAQNRLFELNRETDKPIIVLTDLSPKNNTTVLEIPNNKKSVLIKGILKDKSDISFLKINNKDIPVEKINGQNEFKAEVLLDSVAKINLIASDVYKNIENVDYSIKRTEIDPPKVAVVAPVASDNGEIFLDNNDPSLYIEGKISDESPIKSVLIEGTLASFKPDELNPTFSATISIANKNKFNIVATDIYGNEKAYVYTISRNDLAGTNPMGKTWVVFVENSNYRTFASLEGPTKDVTLMKTVLAKYQVNNVIHKKDLTKEQMEKFFNIELRDLLRSNHVNTLLIWYAGHGKFINETGYWIPIDANRDDEFTYFNINVLRAAMQSYNSLTHTLVVTDACESGPSFYQAMRGQIKEPNCGNWQATRLKSSQVFSSAGYELAQDNSQFTKTFANLLSSNPNACIPIESIVLKVNSAFTQNNAQKPKFGKIAGLTDEDGTFFFMAKDNK